MSSISNADRARILVHALPYIQKYTGKIIVIKYGGNAMINEQLKDSVMRDIVLLSLCLYFLTYCFIFVFASLQNYHQKSLQLFKRLDTFKNFYTMNII